MIPTNQEEDDKGWCSEKSQVQQIERVLRNNRSKLFWSREKKAKKENEWEQFPKFRSPSLHLQPYCGWHDRDWMQQHFFIADIIICALFFMQQMDIFAKLSLTVKLLFTFRFWLQHQLQRISHIESCNFQSKNIEICNHFGILCANLMTNNTLFDVSSKAKIIFHLDYYNFAKFI